MQGEVQETVQHEAQENVQNQDADGFRRGGLQMALTGGE
jgi:hypothetical protein